MCIVATLFLLFLMLGELTSQQCGTDYYSVYQAMLKGHTFQRLKVRPKSIDCRLQCSVDVRCQSYNYVINEHICELNNRTKEARPEHFVMDNDRYYMNKGQKRGMISANHLLTTSLPPSLPPSQCGQILQLIFTQSYVIGILPREWKKAIVSPVYKKDDKSSPKNYRPISLTCTSCKIMEHVLCSHLSNHLEINNILTLHQHGFRKGLSTETQLISVLRDWLSSLDKRIRTDVLLIDFSKAFDSVPRQRLTKINFVP